MPELQILLSINPRDVSADTSIIKDIPGVGGATEVIARSLREIINIHLHENNTLSSAVSGLDDRTSGAEQLKLNF